MIHASTNNKLAALPLFKPGQPTELCLSSTEAGGFGRVDPNDPRCVQVSFNGLAWDARVSKVYEEGRHIGVKVTPRPATRAGIRALLGAGTGILSVTLRNADGQTQSSAWNTAVTY